MLVLASLAVFAGLGWGEQFSSVTFNVVLVSVVFVFALSFLGVWEIPLPGFVGVAAGSHLADREGPDGAFTKGVLTTTLATSCSGPLLGSALTWAVTQPAPLTYGVFATVGAGGRGRHAGRSTPGSIAQLKDATVSPGNSQTRRL